VSAATTVTDETRTLSDSNLDEEPSAGGTLPKRQRGESAASEFDPPEPIQPSMRTVTRRDPASAARHSGSLFDPGETTTPHPEDAVAGQSGPFGHGSAMPLPGGEKPSDDFTIKASATTLRYCSPDSASFPEMVAEVWFRSPEDAEQVGFRPLHQRVVALQRQAWSTDADRYSFGSPPLRDTSRSSSAACSSGAWGCRAAVSTWDTVSSSESPTSRSTILRAVTSTLLSSELTVLL